MGKLRLKRVSPLSKISVVAAEALSLVGFIDLFCFHFHKRAVKTKRGALGPYSVGEKATTPNEAKLGTLPSKSASAPQAGGVRKAYIWGRMKGVGVGASSSNKQGQTVTH